MLKTMFEIIATMADDPDKYRSDIRTKLLELADTMPLALMAREPNPPKAGSMGEDGVFVPEGNPEKWDITSLIEGKKR